MSHEIDQKEKLNPLGMARAVRFPLLFCVWFCLITVVGEPRSLK